MNLFAIAWSDGSNNWPARSAAFWTSASFFVSTVLILSLFDFGSVDRRTSTRTGQMRRQCGAAAAVLFQPVTKASLFQLQVRPYFGTTGEIGRKNGSDGVSSLPARTGTEMGGDARGRRLRSLSRQGSGTSRCGGCGPGCLAVGPTGPGLGQGTNERGPSVLGTANGIEARTSKTGRVDPRRKITRRARFAVMLKSPADRRKRQFVPRDFFPFEELDLKAFGSRLDIIVEQSGSIYQLHLADPRNVVDRQQALDLDPRTRLFPGLALRARAR